MPRGSWLVTPDKFLNGHEVTVLRKTMEVEILKEALDVARAKKPTLHLPSWSAAEGGSR